MRVSSLLGRRENKANALISYRGMPPNVLYTTASHNKSGTLAYLLRASEASVYMVFS